MVEPNIEIWDLNIFHIGRRWILSVLLYGTNNPAILTNDTLYKDCCPIFSCPTSQNIGLVRDVNVDVWLDDYLWGYNSEN